MGVHLGFSPTHTHTNKNYKHMHLKIGLFSFKTVWFCWTIPCLSLFVKSLHALKHTHIDTVRPLDLHSRVWLLYGSPKTRRVVRRKRKKKKKTKAGQLNSSIPGSEVHQAGAEGNSFSRWVAFGSTQFLWEARGAKQTAPVGIASFLYATAPRQQANHNIDSWKTSNVLSLTATDTER